MTLPSVYFLLFIAVIVAVNGFSEKLAAELAEQEIFPRSDSSDSSGSSDEDKSKSKSKSKCKVAILDLNTDFSGYSQATAPQPETIEVNAYSFYLARFTHGTYCKQSLGIYNNGILVDNVMTTCGSFNGQVVVNKNKYTLKKVFEIEDETEDNEIKIKYWVKKSYKKNKYSCKKRTYSIQNGENIYIKKEDSC